MEAKSNKLCHLSPVNWPGEPTRDKRGWIRTTCKVCGGFVGIGRTRHLSGNGGQRKITFTPAPQFAATLGRIHLCRKDEDFAMPKVSQIYGGTYLSGADLAGKTHQLTIEAVGVEEVGEEREEKLVVAFVGAQKVWS